MNFIKNRKVGFIGAGNMAQSIIKALADTQSFAPGHIYATNRSSGKLKKIVDAHGVVPLTTNEELVDTCDIVILAVKPQDLVSVLEPIASSFTDSHVVVSLAAGFSLKSLHRLLPTVRGLARAMPNTAASIQRAVVGYCLADGADEYEGTIEELLKPLGLVVPADEGEMFEALTVSCGSGTGFVLELMQYWQEWIEERGFEPEIARKMVVQTFLGASALCEKAEPTTILELQDRVASKKGVTGAGLQSMRELELERGLRYSFEKAALRDQEISRGTAKQ